MEPVVPMLLLLLPVEVVGKVVLGPVPLVLNYVGLDARGSSRRCRDPNGNSGCGSLGPPVVAVVVVENILVPLLSLLLLPSSYMLVNLETLI